MSFAHLPFKSRLIGKELSRRLIEGKRLYFPYLRIHIVDIESMVSQNRDLITKVDRCCFPFINFNNHCSQMKPLFSKGKGKEIYFPGDPRRREFEKEWRFDGKYLEEIEDMEGQPIAVEIGEASKVSNLFLLGN